MKKKIAVAAAVVLGLLPVGGVAWAKNTDNDHVLSGEKGEYQEYFKTDKLSCNRSDCKNYLYTVTEIPAPAPGKCVVVTGAKETTVAVSCNNSQG